MKKGTFKRFLCILFSFIFIFSMTPSIEVSAKSKLYKNTIQKYKEILLSPQTQWNYFRGIGKRFACVDINGDKIPELFIDSGDKETRDYYGYSSSAVVINMFCVDKKSNVSMPYSSWVYDINWYYCKSKSTVMIVYKSTKQQIEYNGYCDYTYCIEKYKNNKMSIVATYTKRVWANGKTSYYDKSWKKITAKKAQKIRKKYLPDYKKIKYKTITAKNVKKYVK